MVEIFGRYWQMRWWLHCATKEVIKSKGVRLIFPPIPLLKYLHFPQSHFMKIFAELQLTYHKTLITNAFLQEWIFNHSWSCGFLSHPHHPDFKFLSRKWLVMKDCSVYNYTPLFSWSVLAANLFQESDTISLATPPKSWTWNFTKAEE